MARQKRVIPHTWNGAGYVCTKCGAIKETATDSGSCSGHGKTGFDVWLYHAGAGWYAHEFEVKSLHMATHILKMSVGKENAVAGAILPAGHPLGLFTKKAETK